ncbi:MAG: large repetitive protein, partial [Frankiales bacterium]|nr:large repetitive protein [Frankiales bacterium]
PTSLVGNGRERNLAASPDKRYDTMIQMQQTASSSGGTQTPGQWEAALTNGDYMLTVAVGDASATNSIDRITVEPGTANASVLINNFAPAAGSYFSTVTQRVTVSDGRLTLNATGGSNTKIDFIDAVQAAPDTAAPTASIGLAGYQVSPKVYGGNVVATVTAADEAGGSGVTSVTYSIDGAAAKAYTVPVKVTTLGSHTMTVTATDKSGNVSITTSSWTQQAANLPQLVVSSLDSAALHQAAPRLVFSAVNGFDQAPVRYFTFANTGTQPLTVSGLHFAGTNASSYELADGQPASLTIAPGGSSQVGVRFHPSVPTGCPNAAAVYAIGTINQDATLVFTTNDPLNPTGSEAVSGVNSCYDGGDAEPVLDQIIQGLGYSTIVDSPGADRRFIPMARYLPATDEIQSPYFVAADATQPVQVTALAHYSGPSHSPNEPAGWYNQGAAMSSSSTCNASCKQLFIFPVDPSSTNLGESEKLLPQATGTVNSMTTFSPAGVFGMYGGLGGDSSFTDDGLNWGNVTPRIYEHNVRVFLAYDANRVLIPNTYILADDPGRNPGGKNNDYQDVVWLVSNVAPAVAQGPLVGAATTTDLTKGGTVGAGCVVSGFDGVLANTGGTQCNTSNVAFTGAGLSLTSTAGQLTANTQQNALYKSFDATRGQFTVDAKVVGPITTLTSGSQQIGAWFGPDQNNWVKVQADHTGAGENITMTYREKGTSSTVATVAVPGLTTASTVDLVIVGNTSVPDPATGAAHNFPLDEVTVFYSLNGGPLIQVGTVKYPADVETWFSRMAKAGILVSNAGSVTPVTARFTKFSITAP